MESNPGELIWNFRNQLKSTKFNHLMIFAYLKRNNLYSMLYAHIGKIMSQKRFEDVQWTSSFGPKCNLVDARTKNVRRKDVHKRTFTFGSIWKPRKTSELELLINVPKRDVLQTSFSRPWFFFSPSLTWKFLNICNVLPAWENWEQELQI